MVDYQKPSKEKEKLPEAKRDKDEVRIEKIVVGEVKTRKRPLGARLKETFFGGEGKIVVQYLGAEVLLPALRNLLVDSITKGTERMVYGDSPQARPRSSYSPHMTYGQSMSYTNYARASSPTNRPVVRPAFRSSRYGGYEEFIVPTQRDARLVLERMQDVIDKYDAVSVADMKGLLGEEATPVDENWGWVYLQDAEIRQVREGYVLRLPSPDQI